MSVASEEMLNIRHGSRIPRNSPRLRRLGSSIGDRRVYDLRHSTTCISIMIVINVEHILCNSRSPWQAVLPLQPSDVIAAREHMKPFKSKT